MPKYDPQAQAALRLITRKGQKMTLYRMGLSITCDNTEPCDSPFGNYDPMNPAVAVPTVDIQCPAYGVVLPASQGTIEAFDARILDDPIQRRDFRFVILAAKGLTFNPQGADILRTGEGLYRILGATGLNPAGDGNIIFNLGCTLDVQKVIAP